jgi:hypothetical protein
MSQRPRIDLDGVTLHDPNNPYMPLAVFRFRTTDGLMLLVPESADVIVPFADIESAALDLIKGELRIQLSASYVAKESWVRGSRVLVGDWLDRYVRTSQGT